MDVYLRVSILVVFLCMPWTLQASPQLLCQFSSEPVKIDGVSMESAWAVSTPIVVNDFIGDLDHSLRCIYNKTNIFISASFLDSSENRRHKTRIWKKEKSKYTISSRREDTLILKWNMGKDISDISLSANKPYKADIWYWKAYRTDSSGYADDKFHVYTNNSLPRSKRLISKSGRRFYLRRFGDEGEAAYQALITTTQEIVDELPGYRLKAPSGSRADIHARGNWSGDRWGIEFSRALQTGHSDDIQFTPGNIYQFGISRYEIAGGKLNESLDIPEFGLGDVAETILLRFVPADS